MLKVLTGLEKPDVASSIASSSGSAHITGLDTTQKKSGWRLSAAVVAIGLFFATVAATAFLPPWFSRAGYFASLEDKHRLLASTNSPKVVFVGGSNLALGLDSQKVHEKLQRPVVNMGLCVQFALPYLLEEVKDNIGAGDLIVLSPEYDLLEHHPHVIPSMLLNMPVLYPESTKWILRAYLSDPERGMKLLDMVRLWFSTKWKSFGPVCKFAVRRKLKPEMLENQDVPHTRTGRMYFNQYGDYLEHLGRSVGWEVPQVDLAEFVVCDQALGQLKRFREFAAQRGARVILIPPPIPSKNHPAELTAYDELLRLQKETGIEIVGTPRRYTLPVQKFYDSCYHLMREGREVRTRRVIEDLQRSLAEHRGGSPI